MLKILHSSGTVWGAFFLGVGGILASSAMAFSASNASLIYVWEGFSQVCTPLSFCLLLDSVSLWFLSTVNVIAGSVLLFSVYYMEGEKFYVRFISILMMFVASMALLIGSPGILSIFLGWDGLGVTSFLLVIYFYSDKSLNAGLLTLLTNRLGDIFLLMGVSMVWSSFGGELTSMAGSGFGLYATGSVLFLASMTKSAQIPFSAWLPAAMAAPTPVSALVHSSTLVTAGLYLLIRFSGGLEDSVFWEWGLFFSPLTLLAASFSSLMEMDMKKIVALSTLSQLGLISMTISVQAFGPAFFHLIMHAYFKALLFILMGFWIHQSASYQDLRFASINSSSFSLSVMVTLLALMSLMGVPYFSGFYSKDSVLESLSSLSSIGVVSYGFLVLGCVLTAVYSLRLFKILLGFEEGGMAVGNWSEKSKIFFLSGVLLSCFEVSGGKLMGSYVCGEFFLWVFPLELKILLSSIVVLGVVLSCLFLSFSGNPVLLGNLGFLWGLSFLSFPYTTKSFLTLGSKFESVDMMWLGQLSFRSSVNIVLTGSKGLGSGSLISYKLFSGFYLLGGGVVSMLIWGGGGVFTS
uniref:NADH-ubiquinone oxidoreductase chain 5 n=1 Tax=Tigriopus japonicus TaxID=158387 RepID=Q1EDJ8_TIGJA|nr:NADH dehydrogenase subunit 5 [Tigriopus japonicus]